MNAAVEASKAIREKANRYLTEGRVQVTYLTLKGGDFLVTGTGDEPYKVHFLGEWTCTCPAQVTVCAHIVACQKITRFEPSPVQFTDDSDLSQFLHDALHERR